MGLNNQTSELIQLKKVSGATVKYDNKTTIRPKRRDLEVNNQFLGICSQTDQSTILKSSVRQTQELKTFIEKLDLDKLSIGEREARISNIIDRQKKILIVDDEQFNRMAVGIILELIGLDNCQDKCVYAINGQTALNIVENDIESNSNLYCSFDLILMDC